MIFSWSFGALTPFAKMFSPCQLACIFTWVSSRLGCWLLFLRLCSPWVIPIAHCLAWKRKLTTDAKREFTKCYIFCPCPGFKRYNPHTTLCHNYICPFYRGRCFEKKSNHIWKLAMVQNSIPAYTSRRVDDTVYSSFIPLHCKYLLQTKLFQCFSLSYKSRIYWNHHHWLSLLFICC